MCTFRCLGKASCLKPFSDSNLGGEKLPPPLKLWFQRVFFFLIDSSLALFTKYVLMVTITCALVTKNTPCNLAIKIHISYFWGVFRISFSRVLHFFSAGLQFHLWEGKTISILQRHFHWKISKSTFEEAPRPIPGQTEAMALCGLHVIPGLQYFGWEYCSAGLVWKFYSQWAFPLKLTAYLLIHFYSSQSRL